MDKTWSKKDRDIYGYLFGVGMFAITCLIGIAGITQLVLGGKIGEESGLLLLAAALVSATFASNRFACRMCSKPAMYVTLITSAASMVLLLITGLCMEGSFQNPWISIASVTAGVLLSCVMCLKKTHKNGARKRHSR